MIDTISFRKQASTEKHLIVVRGRVFDRSAGLRPEKKMLLAKRANGLGEDFAHSVFDAGDGPNNHERHQDKHQSIFDDVLTRFLGYEPFELLFH